MSESGLEAKIQAMEAELAREAESGGTTALSPRWWQEQLLDRAASDEQFRVQMLRFTDVLPALRDHRAIADHVQQYFAGTSPKLVRLAADFAAQPLLQPVASRVVQLGVRAVADRFIAGASPEEALPAIGRLARNGMAVTVDLLGEATLSEAEAEVYLARYTQLLATLAGYGEQHAPVGPQWDGVPPINVSIKLSALTSRFETAAPEYVADQLRPRLLQLIKAAQARGAFINVDMEQHRYKDLAHRVFEDVMLQPEITSYPHIGIVVQAYLQDAEADVAWLENRARRRGAPFSVRLVKGAYWDEERIVAAQNSWPAPVYQVKAETDVSYECCTDRLLAAWPHLRPVFGTHNPRSIAQALVKAEQRAIPAAALEFQMLYGLAPELAEAVAARGQRMRIYLPVGAIIPGMAYLVRRLLENTSNQAWFRQGSRPLAAAAPTTPSPRPAPLLSTEFRNAPPLRFFEPEVRSRMQAALGRERSQAGRRYPLLLAGREVVDRAVDAIRYPAEPDLVLGEVAQGTAEDVARAVDAAVQAFPAWRDRPVAQRAGILRRAADLMEEQRFELAATMVFESGKPWREADGDVVEAIDYLRYYARQAEELMPPLLELPGEENEYLREGRGVTAVISPWNFPLAILTGMAVAALAAGNAVVVKPAGPSPIIAYRLVRLLHQAGVPPEVVQFLPGPGDTVGQALTEHPEVVTIAFTGSNAVGLSIIARAAQLKPGQRDIKRVIAELGGKNAVIIDDDADLDQAIADTVTSAFGYAGQKCSACSRLVVVGSAYREMLDRLQGAVESLLVGPPHDSATFVPPVISGSARERILGYITSGDKTASRLASARIPGGPGNYVPPTVFTDVPLDAPIAQEEIFGPVLSVFYAQDFAEALRIATHSAYALTGGLFSRNPRHIALARQEFRVGNLYINRRITGAMIGRQPFGGLHMSGEGEKAGGPDYLRQFTNPRVITENTMRRGFAPE